ncbi:hypothetical protein [Geotalea uraniireducens]|uniref:Uncharacterized protein n=1 Tax=Geotalea uraniireducens (strain Rf4) TaxID=351605 RepID=A5G6S3_GEOUR|nr:hypothetical protein [Geotalea uraniireducens]ABQ27491.1 hypothetical protein Gura_3334 [Geotalea uraniireducens Rf4]
MKQQLWKMLLLTSFILSALGISGCGGGGSTATTSGTAITVSGTALAGAPLFGNAWIKDANGKKKGPVAIDKNGNFAFTNMTGMQAPFILQADGTAGTNSYRLCSMATGGGTANINPMTNLAVAAVTGKDPAAVFTDPTANNIKNSINDTAVAAAIAQIKAMLKPILDAYNASAVDPLKGNVAATNSGLDGVFDVVKINVTPDNTGAAQVSVSNNLTNSTILQTQTVSTAVANTTQTAATITTQTTGLSTDAANLQAITAQLQLLATELGKTTPNLDPFFATNFGINSGLDRAQSILQLAPPGKITGISPISVVQKTANGASFDYEVSFLAYFADGSNGAPDDNFIFTNEGGAWRLKGNNYKSYVRIQPQAYRWIDAVGTTTVKTGLDVEAEDPGVIGIATITITGPGLPAAGLTMTSVGVGVTYFNIIQAQQDPTLNTLTNQWNFLPLSDATITGTFAATAAPFTYTFTVKDANGATIETRTKKLAVGPLLSATLDATYFPTISGLASQAMSLLTGKSSISFFFAKPTAYTVQEQRANLSFWNETSNGYYDTEPLLTDTQATITGGIPSTLQGAWLSMGARDGSGRRFDAVLIFK